MPVASQVYAKQLVPKSVGEVNASEFTGILSSSMKANDMTYTDVGGAGQNRITAGKDGTHSNSKAPFLTARSSPPGDFTRGSISQRTQDRYEKLASTQQSASQSSSQSTANPYSSENRSSQSQIGMGVRAKSDPVLVQPGGRPTERSQK